MNNPLRVLIVEDSVPDAELLLNELRQGSYEPAHEIVDTAGAMEEALDKKKWDIVLADYIMPGFGAMEAMELLKAENLDLPFIVVSGVVGEDTAVQVMKAGAGDFVLKSNLVRLVPAVDRELSEAEDRKKRRKAERERDQLAELLRVTNEKLIVTSIQMQERTEETLQLTLELDATINSLVDGVLVFNRDATIVRANPAATRMLGYTPSDHNRPLIERAKMLDVQTIDGKPFPPEEAPVFKALKGETVENVLLVIHPLQGGTVWVSVGSSPIRKPDGTIIGAVSVLRDVTALQVLREDIEKCISGASPELK